MKPYSMGQQNNKETIHPHELAEKFEHQIKETIANKFFVALEELSILSSDKEGVYLSEKEPNTLCCFVVGEKNGFLYLVTAKIEEDGKNLNNFKSDIVS